MTSELFESLLFEEEGTVLDFKSKQYPFSGVNDFKKSELLKDILGFANAWRREPNAYIVIGVEEVRGGQSKVVGIERQDHLEDHSLQQFVNSRINQPIQFRYEAYEYAGKQVGIICINEVNRPAFLLKDFGKLKKNEVYVRRGSSTDPSKPAAPDEIARMGLSTSVEEARLEVSFADVERDVQLGPDIPFFGEFCDTPEKDNIPYCIDDRPKKTFDLNVSFRRWNRDYFRDLAYYEFMRRIYKPVRLAIKNVSSRSARNVRVEVELSRLNKIQAIEVYEFPRAPRIEKDIAADISSIPLGTMHKTPGRVDVTNKDERSLIEIDCFDMQPGRVIYSDQFLVGIGQSGKVELSGRIFSDSCSKPFDFALRFDAEIKRTSITIDELCEMEEPDDEY